MISGHLGAQLCISLQRILYQTTGLQNIHQNMVFLGYGKGLYFWT